MKKSLLLFSALSVMFLFTQCRTPKTGVDSTTSATKTNKSDKKLTDSPIKRCSYLRSGMMGRKQWSVTRQDDGQYKVKFSQMTNMNNDIPVNLEITTDSKIEKDLHALLREANIQNATLVLQDEPRPIIHDAPNSIFEVTFMDNVSYSNKKPYDESPEINQAIEKVDNYILDFVRKNR